MIVLGNTTIPYLIGVVLLTNIGDKPHERMSELLPSLILRPDQ